MGRVYLCHGDACPLRCVAAEAGELMERPGGDQALVCAGGGGLPAMGPTACACRALAETSTMLPAHDAHALRFRRRDDLMGTRMGAIAHPAVLFVPWRLRTARTVLAFRRPFLYT